MPDLRQTRKNIKTALAVLVGVDVVAVVCCFRRWWARPIRGARI
jgi:hypothetical protein